MYSVQELSIASSTVIWHTMQRLGRAAEALLHLQRKSTVDALQQIQRAQCAVLLSQINVSAGQPCGLQVQPSVSQGYTTHSPSSHSSSFSFQSCVSPWHHQHPNHQHHRQLYTGWSTPAAANLSISSNSSSSMRCYSSGDSSSSSTISPLRSDAQSSTAAAAPSAAGAAGTAAGGSQGAPAASAQQASAAGKPAPSTASKGKPIQGICRRRNIKCGWKKIDFVLRMIRRSTVDDAMAQLNANPKRAAMFVKHAIANARNNAICAGGDPQKLWVAEAFVTRGKYEKRVHFMSRGYSSLKETRHSHLNVRVEQMDRRTAARVALRRSPRLIAPIMQRMMEGRRTPGRLFVKGGGSSSGGSSGDQQRAYA